MHNQFVTLQRDLADPSDLSAATKQQQRRVDGPVRSHFLQRNTEPSFSFSLSKSGGVGWWDRSIRLHDDSSKVDFGRIVDSSSTSSSQIPLNTSRLNGHYLSVFPGTEHEGQSADYGLQCQGARSYTPADKEASAEDLPVNSTTNLSTSPAPSTTSKATEDNFASSELCVVCGDEGAKYHYGVLACLGCKGFFRRALKKADQYECANEGRCVIDKYERNSCRFCRLQKCLESGMDPAAVRPDRDFTGKHLIRSTSRKPKTCTTSGSSRTVQQLTDVAVPQRIVLDHDDWAKKLPIQRGDTQKDASEVYPLTINTIREVIEDPQKLRGKRTEMRYEPYRMARNEELSVIVYRRLIAAIDWVEFLSEMMDGLSTEDRIILVKSTFAPLMLFKASARTAIVTSDNNMLCLCNWAYVPRNIGQAYSDTYHLDNGLVACLLNNLVTPFRQIRLSEAEIVCLSAIIVLNPMAKDLSEEGLKKVSQLRDKIHDTLYQIIKESRPDVTPTSQFGNFLLYLPTVTSLSNSVSENIRFAQTFSKHGSIPLLTNLFGCFPVEPFLESDIEANHGNEVILKDVEVQTEQTVPSALFLQLTDTLQERGHKRRCPLSFTSPVENECNRDFRLLKAPSAYTLLEMFDDRMDKDDAAYATPPAERSSSALSAEQMTWPLRYPNAGTVRSNATETMDNRVTQRAASHLGSNLQQVPRMPLGQRHSFNAQLPVDAPGPSTQFSYPASAGLIPVQAQFHPIGPNQSAFYPNMPCSSNLHPPAVHIQPPPIENLTFRHYEPPRT